MNRTLLPPLAANFRAKGHLQIPINITKSKTCPSERSKLSQSFSCTDEEDPRLIKSYFDLAGESYELQVQRMKESTGDANKLLSRATKLQAALQTDEQMAAKIFALQRKILKFLQ